MIGVAALDILRAERMTDAVPLSSVTSLPTSVLDQPLAEAPVGDGNTTGFFRNNFCDASPLDPGSHTVAAVVNKDFLDYSASTSTTDPIRLSPLS